MCKEKEIKAELLKKMEEKKRKLRQELLRKRGNLSRNEINAKSGKIENRLFALPEFQRAKTVMFYVSFRNEVATGKMMRNAMKLKKRIAVPVVHGEKIVAYEIKNPKKELSKGSFGIREPKKEFRRRVNRKEIDLVVVPGVVFDKRGGRLGYGRGYYDRFLGSKSTKVTMNRSHQCALVGLAFDLQIAREIPLKRKDVKVDKIVTENRIINCKSQR
ncbi:MAG: 5-formyltetrahydrofolate cyclo-ligase [Elusimicrobiota bacterium]|nr:5-formyltetrahydrofolate cyclo-ligase [Elusimicrobiota bacterium]